MTQLLTQLINAISVPNELKPNLFDPPLKHTLVFVYSLAFIL